MTEDRQRSQVYTRELHPPWAALACASDLLMASMLNAYFHARPPPLKSRRYTLAAYPITSGNDAPDRDPKNWQLQGSDYGIAWTTLDTRTGETFVTRGLSKDYVVSGTTAAYRRLPS